LFHALSNSGGITLVDCKEVAYLAAVFQEEVVPTAEPSAHYYVLVVQHNLLGSRRVVLRLEACRGQQSQCGGIFCHQIHQETGVA